MSGYSVDQPEWRQKQLWERAAACNISFTPTPDQVREAVAWINENARNENGTVGWKKVVDHFITHWGLAGEDVLPNTLGWSALAKGR